MALKIIILIMLHIFIFIKAQCNYNQYSCSSHTGLECISFTKHCDGVNDCWNGNDESTSECRLKICNFNQFQCDYGGCIADGKRCDGSNDCWDFSDERGCQTTSSIFSRRNEPQVNTVQKNIGNSMLNRNPYPYQREKNCTVPVWPANGKIVTESGTWYNEVQSGNTVENGGSIFYRCNDGYVLNDELNDHQNCSNGNWKPNISITCTLHIRRFFQSTSTTPRPSCYSNYHCGENSVCVNRDGRYLECFCLAGYDGDPQVRCNPIYTTPSSLAVVQVRRSTPPPSSWSQTQSESYCVAPKPPSNGRLVNERDKSVTYNLGDRILNNVAIEYVCDRGFMLDGTDVRQVCSNGLLSRINQNPKCVRSCDGNVLKSSSLNPICRNVHNQTIDCDSSTLAAGTYVTLHCAAHYDRPNTIHPGYVVCNEYGRWSHEIYECNIQCGVMEPKSKRMTTFVQNGEDIDIRKVPWHVGVYKKMNDYDYDYKCGGSIINSKIVITAAHCFWNERHQRIENKNVYKISAGKTYRDYNHLLDRAQKQNFDISDVYVDSRYDDLNNFYKYDLAIVTVVDTITFSSYIKPVCVDYLMTDVSSNRLRRNLGDGLIVGWGRTLLDEVTDELQQTNFRAVDYNECVRNFNDNLQANFVTDDKFCAGHLGRSTVCKGDSGGGLVFKQNASSTSVYYLHGVVSTGIQAENSRTCDMEKYTIFTNVYSFIEQIKIATARAFS